MDVGQDIARVDGTDSEDELDWEEVEVPEKQDIEITLPATRPLSKAGNANKYAIHVFN